MSGMVCLQSVRGCPQGLFPGIGFLADMGQKDRLRLFRHNGIEYFRACLVAEVAVIGSDPHFQIIRTACLHQHLDIVVAFENDVIGAFQQRQIRLPDVAGISYINQFLLPGFQDIPHRTGGVMGPGQQASPSCAAAGTGVQALPE